MFISCCHVVYSKMIFNLLFLQVSLFLGCVYCQKKVDWDRLIPCDSSLCPPKTKHIGCVDHWQIAKACGPETKIVAVNAELAEHILQFINVVRNMVASGHFNLTAAARMPTMGWSHELAFGAGLLARQCDRTGYFCSNTPRFHYVASTELLGNLDSRTPVAALVIAQFLPVWMTDVVGCRMDANNTIYPVAPGQCVGHYIPVIQDKGNRIGCIMRTSRAKDGSMDVALVCLFSRANVNGTPPYEVSTQPASECLTGKNPLYEYLCSADEKVNNNERPNLPDIDEGSESDSLRTCKQIREFLSDHVHIDEI